MWWGWGWCGHGPRSARPVAGETARTRTEEGRRGGMDGPEGEVTAKSLTSREGNFCRRTIPSGVTSLSRRGEGSVAGVTESLWERHEEVDMRGTRRRLGPRNTRPLGFRKFGGEWLGRDEGVPGTSRTQGVSPRQGLGRGEYATTETTSRSGCGVRP